MKNIHVLKLLVALIGISTSAISKAQNFNLTDINKTKNSYPYNYTYPARSMFAELNGIFYFSADDGVHGNELYSSDGTEFGTRLVKDILPGNSSSNPSEIVACGNKIYFTAYDSQQRQLIWVSDGTEVGTKLLPVIIPESGFTFSRALTDVNGTLFFIQWNSGEQLWKSDGTEEGTVLVSNLYGYYNSLVNVDGKLFFSFYDNSSFSGTELYTSDGTSEGTQLVADINPYPYAGSDPSHFTTLNGLLYFSADDGTGIRLYVSDGTAAGTHTLKNNSNVYLFRGDEPFAVRDNRLFFQGSTPASGNELYKYYTADTINNSITLVKDIVPGETSSYPSFMTNVNGTIFFTIGPAGADAQLWKSDGTKAGTVLVKNINPGGLNNYSGLINFNGKLLFGYGENALGNELWKSDGTSAGTVLVKDIMPGTTSSNPALFTYKHGIFLFSANGPKGNELWRTDGTEHGTVMVKNINSTTTSGSNSGGFAALPGNKVIFSADDGTMSTGDLFVSDGSSVGTKRIDVPVYVNRYVNAYPGKQVFVNLNNSIYFIDYSFGLWKTDGTKAGTSLVSILASADNSSAYITNFLATGNLLYVTLFNYNTSQITLWRSDGSAKGTFIVKSDISTNYQLYLATIGNTLFFSNFDPNTNNSEFWKTDGSIPSTVVVKAITSFNYNPLLNLYNFNGKLYFSAYTPTNNYGPSLWTSDGTEAGTHVVKEIAILQQPFAQANGKLFFSALDAISKGYELYASDGTAAGTKIVKDVNNGSLSSYVSSLVSGDTMLYFLADDGIHGNELWKSNGTGTGTELLKDIAPGINSPYINSYEMINVKDKLFFTVNDTLWHSNGTKKGTLPVKDKNLEGVTRIHSLTAVDKSLYFQGYTYAAGDELYVGSSDVNQPPFVKITSPSDGSNYAASATITLSADATDIDGTVKTVDFYNGNKLIFTETWPPFYRKWFNVPAGKYSITAKATDNEGKIATSEIVMVSLGVQSLFANNTNSNELVGKSDLSKVALNVNPNPAINILNVYTQGISLNKKSTISILSASGVTMKIFSSTVLNKNMKLDISSLSAGVYYIKVLDGDRVTYRQFVKM